MLHLAVSPCGRDICKLQPGGGDSAIDGGVVHNQDLQRAPELWEPFWERSADVHGCQPNSRDGRGIAAPQVGNVAAESAEGQV